MHFLIIILYFARLLLLIADRGAVNFVKIMFASGSVRYEIPGMGTGTGSIKTARYGVFVFFFLYFLLVL
mgnify:CR=1 FL=1|jgi:hypothetical protein